MNKSVILLLALGLAIGIFFYSKQSSQHIEDYNTAVEHLKNNEYTQAIPYLEKANSAKPDEERILTALEEAYMQTGQEDKAKEIRMKLGK